MTDPHPEPWDDERAAALIRRCLAELLDDSLCLPKVEDDYLWCELMLRELGDQDMLPSNQEDARNLIYAIGEEALALIRHMGNPLRPSPIRQLTLAVRCSAQCLVRDCLPPLLHQHPEVQKRLIGIGDTTREIEVAEVRLIDRLTPTEQKAKEPSP